MSLEVSEANAARRPGAPRCQSNQLMNGMGLRFAAWRISEHPRRGSANEDDGGSGAASRSLEPKSERSGASHAARLAMRPALSAAGVMLCDPARAGFPEYLCGEAQAPITAPTKASRPPTPRKIDHIWRAAARPAASATDSEAVTAIRAKATWAVSWATAPAGLVSLTNDVQPRRAQFCAKDRNSSKIVVAARALMRDPTLQRGDDVVTDEGVRVLEGRQACPTLLRTFGRLPRRALWARARARPSPRSSAT